MTRPINKTSLLDLSEHNFQSLFKLIATFTADEQVGIFPFDDRDRCIRDVLCHLHHWHLMLQKWYVDGMNGDKPIIPAEGYTWKTLPALNEKIWQLYQQTELKTAVELLQLSHVQMMKLIEKHSEESLFTKKWYKWTGTTSLASYFISSTSSHYDWAIKKIKKYKKTISHMLPVK